MLEHEILYQEFQKEFDKFPRDNAQIEILHAKYTHAFHKFEEKVFMECRLSRHELMLKRANFG